VEEAKAVIRQGMQRREIRFLHKVEQAIFANRASPYLKLFRNAGCELGDVKKLVGQEGVEGALERLREAGVYVTFGEFKGRTPAVRGSQTFVFRDTDFDNPLITAHYYSTSGGSRGRASRIIVDLEHLAEMTPHWLLWFSEHDVLSAPLVFVGPSYPSSINHHLMSAKAGTRFTRWFCTGGGGSLMYRLASGYVQTAGRWIARFPRPINVPLTEVDKIGHYLLTLTTNGRRIAVHTSPSTAVRICLAMQERGKSLRDITFLLGAEPLTSTRRRTVEASEAVATVTYGFSEGGNIGSQCANAAVADDIHVSLDTYAVIQGADRASVTVDALLVTAFRWACPKVLLNTEIGDSAVMERRSCDCLFGELGYDQHLHTIRSFDKLTGEGATFLGADVIHVLEEILPAKFGGSLADYQLIEEKDLQGLPRYTLLVSPEVGPLEESAVVGAFLSELGRRRRPYGFMANQWMNTSVVQVKRNRPVLTARGKLLPFRTLAR